MPRTRPNTIFNGDSVISVDGLMHLVSFLKTARLANLPEAIDQLENVHCAELTSRAVLKTNEVQARSPRTSEPWEDCKRFLLDHPYFQV